ncbi:hypothetical protein ACLB2K_052947 [Fragaria x ananassa]
MEKIEHQFVEVGGLKLHVAEIGRGPKLVVFLHGFPEVWYSWRHQMIAVANNGYRAIAFDCRGCGLSELPAEPEKATFKDLVDEVVGVLDALAIDKVIYAKLVAEVNRRTSGKGNEFKGGEYTRAEEGGLQPSLSRV